MESGQQTDTDRALDQLGREPANQVELVARYAGHSRITAKEADALFATLEASDQGAEPVGTANRNLVQNIDGPSSFSDRDQVGADLVGDHVSMPGNPSQRFSSPTDDHDRHDLVEQQPLTRRMDAREVRSTPPAAKSRFSDGLKGADDLPEFPTRSPLPAKPIVAEKTVAALNADEPSDGFEILIDDEILEIEPDDSILEDSNDES